MHLHPYNLKLRCWETAVYLFAFLCYWSPRLYGRCVFFELFKTDCREKESHFLPAGLYGQINLYPQWRIFLCRKWRILIFFPPWHQFFSRVLEKRFPEQSWCLYRRRGMFQQAQPIDWCSYLVHLGVAGNWLLCPNFFLLESREVL